MSFVNLRIGYKIAAIVVALTLATLCYVLVLTNRIDEIDDAYSAMLDKTAAGVTSLARGNARLQQVGYASYRVLVYDGKSAQAKAAADEARGAIDNVEKAWDKASGLLPAYASEIAKIRAPFKSVAKIVDDAIGAGLRNQNDVAQTELAKIDPILTDVSKNTLDLLARIDTDMRASSKKMSETNDRYHQWVVGIAAVTGLLGLVLSQLMATRTITGPLLRLSGRMSDLAGGDLSVMVEGRERKDEIGQMAGAVEVFKGNAIKARELEAEARAARAAAEEERARNETQRAVEAERQALVVTRLGSGLTQLANGDLTVRMSQFPTDYVQLETDFNLAIAKLQETMAQITATALSIDTGTDEIAEAADNLSKRTEQQAASLEETAAALEEITATVKKTAEGANHARDAVESAKAEAESSSKIVRDAVSAMGGIEKSSSEITQIIGVIDEIAFQTNLLALNAGVEAARAGDAGRGFAVVASEVRALAQRSAEAAKQIKGLISTSTSQVASGVTLVGQTGKALTRILEQVSDVASVVRNIAASAQEQAVGLEQVNTAVTQMDQITQQNAAMVEESTAATHSVSKDTQALSSMIARFHIGEGTGGRAVGATPIRAIAKGPVLVKRPPAARPAGRTAGATVHALRSEPAETWSDF